MIGQHAFGARLRAQRERRGIALVSIAESTKIKRSLLEGLERGDVSQWPRGLFRRAYIRDYACAIGLPPAPLVEEFGRLFPEERGDDRPGEGPEPMRLTLAGDPDTGLRRLAKRALCAGLEMAAVVVVGAIAAAATDVAFSTACASVALIYYPAAATVTGRTMDVGRLRALLPRAARVVGPPPEASPETARLFVAGEEFPQHHTASH